MQIFELYKISVQEEIMKSIRYFFYCSSLLLLSLLLTSCITDTKSSNQKSPLAGDSADPAGTNKSDAAQSSSLPIKYQTANYLVDKVEGEDIAIAEEGKLKVGARITSTKGPQPLWDIVKRLASLKAMNVSWASDVDRNVLVDVDFNANDDFHQSLDQMLRQVDYYHEMQGNTLVVKFKDTRQFQIAMPFTKQSYSTATGGNVLGNSQNQKNIEGVIALKSKDNEFDTWENIKLNIESIMDIWSYRREADMVKKGTTSAGKGEEGARSYKVGADKKTSKDKKTETENKGDGEEAAVENQQRGVGGRGYYIIDKPVGLITVTAPRPILEKIDAYITTLKKSLYQQISIEAKIIEVVMVDNSTIGINWSKVLKNFNLNGVVTMGDPTYDEKGKATGFGQVYPFIYSNDAKVGPVTYTDSSKTSYFKTINPGQFVTNIFMENAPFDIFLNALNEQGNTKVLSNPKISVMNGQPAMITVGRNVTYIDNIDSKIDTETRIVTYTVNTERILSGVGMALTATILGKNEVIMNLVPITSELVEPIVYKDVGNLGGTVGLPVVNVREMNTTVKVNDGEMLVIGGLISDSDESTGEFAPMLGEIPYLKYLFGYDEKKHLKRELIILLRPRII
jgi:MSHA type pilus biogenesis protein MshL